MIPVPFPTITLGDIQSIVDYQSSRLRSIIRTYLEHEHNRPSQVNAKFLSAFYKEMEVCGTWIAIASVKYEGLVRAPPCYKECMLVVVNRGTGSRDCWLDAIADTSGVPDGYLDHYERAWWKNDTVEPLPIRDCQDAVVVWKAQRPRMTSALAPLPRPIIDLESLSLARLQSARAVARDLRVSIANEIAERSARLKGLQARQINISMELNRVRALEIQYQKNKALGTM